MCSLAKDHFVAKQNPADAALQYMALGRRSLLQVIWPMQACDMMLHCSNAYAALGHKLCGCRRQESLSAGHCLDGGQKRPSQGTGMGGTQLATQPDYAGFPRQHIRSCVRCSCPVMAAQLQLRGFRRPTTWNCQ